MGNSSIHLLFKDTGKLAFWCMIIAWIMQLIIFKETTRPVFPFAHEGYANLAQRLFILSIIGRVWLVAGMALIIKIFVYKEPKGLAFKVAFIGLGVLLVLEVVAVFMSLLTSG